jgi:hypothetical protein
MDDSNVQDRIESLVEEEQRLFKTQGLSPDEHQRMEDIRVNLDRCWDLLRQRRAKRDAGLDPDEAEVRDAGTVEGYRG